MPLLSDSSEADSGLSLWSSSSTMMAYSTSFIKESKYLDGIEGGQSFLYSKDLTNYYKLKITVAGMPSACYEHVTFKNFKLGASYKGKKQPKNVPGGVILQEVDFTIKE